MAIRNKARVLNKIIIFTIILIAVAGYLDNQQIKGVQETQEWVAYEEFVAPIFNISWLLFFIIAAVIYWLFTKDLSESLAIFVVPIVLVKAGLEDLFFFIFSGEIPNMMCWFGPWQNTISKYVLQESCVSPLGLVLNVIVAVVIVYFVFKFLKKQRW